jgi:hypothetical protein
MGTSSLLSPTRSRRARRGKGRSKKLDLAKLPRPLAADRVDSVPPPPGCTAIALFEYVAAGGSTLLRVGATPAPEAGTALLVIDHGEEIELLTPLPSTRKGGALGFACESRLLEGTPSFWLQLDGLRLGLAAPAARVL